MEGQPNWQQNALPRHSDFAETDLKPSGMQGLEEAGLIRGIGEMSGSGAPGGALSATGANRPDIARQVAAQIAQVVVRQPDQPVEIALNPEELGKVRLSLSGSESGMTVSVLAERGETLDLLRRNIEQLAAEFRELGYSSIGFEFGNGASEFTNSDDNTPEHEGLNLAVVADDLALAQPTVPDTGLDLRL